MTFFRNISNRFNRLMTSRCYYLLALLGMAICPIGINAQPLPLEVVRMNKLDTIATLQPKYRLKLMEVVRMNLVDTIVTTQVPKTDTINLETVTVDRLDTIVAAVSDNVLKPIDVVRVNDIDTILTFSEPTDRQIFSLQPEYSKRRTQLATAMHTLAYGGTLLLLNQAWYSQYERSKFHVFNDGREWLQMDKVGHAWTAYQLARTSLQAWQWAGVSQKKQILYGGLGGAAFQTIIEVLDGFSAEWGWSWGDVAANFVGSGFMMAQAFAWGEQRIAFKFGFHRMTYKEAYLNTRSDQLFGKTLSQRGLKDYNGQTYWASANLKRFFPKSKLPAWLNLAVGYGAEGMFGGYENSWTDPTTQTVMNAYQYKRVRQWYLAPDIDFMKIPTKNKWIRSLLFVMNAVKMPTPTLEFSQGKFVFHGFYL